MVPGPRGISPADSSLPCPGSGIFRNAKRTRAFPLVNYSTNWEKGDPWFRSITSPQGNSKQNHP